MYFINIWGILLVGWEWRVGWNLIEGGICCRIKFRLRTVFKFMDYDLESIDFKIPYEQQPSTKTQLPKPQFNLKNLIERHRKDSLREESEVVTLKYKLSEAYDKLSKQIELTNSQQQVIDKLEKMLEEERAEGSKVKKVLRDVIQNRKHIERQMSQFKGIVGEYKHKEQEFRKEIEVLNQNLTQANSSKTQLEDQLKNLKLTFENRVKAVRSQNTRFEDQKIKLERQLIQKDTQTSKLKEQNKRLQYLHIQNNNLLARIEQLQSKFTTHTESRITDQNSKNQLNSDVVVIGKWQIPQQQTKRKQVAHGIELTRQPRLRQTLGINPQEKNMGKTQVTEQRSCSKSVSERDITKLGNKSMGENAISIEDALTQQQKRKERLEQELNKMSNIRKLTPAERQVIEELEKELYDASSQIAGLKRKIRHRY